MKMHPKLTIYEVFSQYLPIFSVWATTNIGSIFTAVAANIRYRSSLPFIINHGGPKLYSLYSRSSYARFWLLSLAAVIRGTFSVRPIQGHEGWGTYYLEHRLGAVSGDSSSRWLHGCTADAASGDMPEACLIDLRRLTEAGALGVRL
jgi:hypothetical protein